MIALWLAAARQRFARYAHCLAGELNDLAREGHVAGKEAAQASHPFVADGGDLDIVAVFSGHDQRDDPCQWEDDMADRLPGFEQNRSRCERKRLHVREKPSHRALGQHCLRAAGSLRRHAWEAYSGAC